MPQDKLQPLQDEFQFDFDPCPFPRPDGFDGLEVDWGKSNWVNPPFTRMAKIPGKRKIGPMAWARKALAESEKGNTSVLIFPIYQVRVISFLEDHKAEVRYVGKIRWLAVEDGTPNPAESSSIQPCVILVVRAACRYGQGLLSVIEFEKQMYMNKAELKTIAKYYTIKNPVEPSAVTAVESAFIAGFELCQQLLQQTQCTTMREYVAQQLSYVMQRPLSSITDGQKMAYNDVLLAIDRPELNIVLPPVA